MITTTLRWRGHAVTGVTGLNLVCGFFATMAAVLGHLSLAAGCLLICMVFDALDGWLARRWEVASEFGVQMDSLADMTSFVVAGAALAFTWVSAASSPLGLVAVAVYVFCGAMRLARFNVGAGGEVFEGLPTTAAGGALALLSLVFPQVSRGLGALLVLGLGLLMISRIPCPKLTPMLSRLFSRNYGNR